MLECELCITERRCRCGRKYTTSKKEPEPECAVCRNTTGDDPMERTKKVKSYTEHEGKIHYSNGDTEEVTFDGMKREKNGVVLKDYMETRKGKMKKRAVNFIPYDNLRNIETVERREKEIVL